MGPLVENCASSRRIMLYFFLSLHIAMDIEFIRTTMGEDTSATDRNVYRVLILF